MPDYNSKKSIEKATNIISGIGSLKIRIIMKSKTNPNQYAMRNLSRIVGLGFVFDGTGATGGFAASIFCLAARRLRTYRMIKMEPVSDIAVTMVI